MASPENTNWLSDFAFIDDVPVPVFNWPLQAINGTSNNGGVEINGTFGIVDVHKEPNASVEINDTFGDADAHEVPNTKKRCRSESCGTSSSKACREKLRRDRLNDKFMELGSILEPGRPPKTDKAAVLIDTVRMVTQLRGEVQKLKDSNSNLQEKIKELKVEKNELRDEKQRLKAEKEKLEQQLKMMNTQPSFMPPLPAIPAAFAAQGQAPGNKLVPFVGYPGVAMWQFMPPAVVDTSQDHVLRPPVA